MTRVLYPSQCITRLRLLHFRIEVMWRKTVKHASAMFLKEIKKLVPRALLSYISTREFLRAREKCGFLKIPASLYNSTMHEEQVYFCNKKWTFWPIRARARSYLHYNFLRKHGETNFEPPSWLLPKPSVTSQKREKQVEKRKFSCFSDKHLPTVCRATRPASISFCYLREEVYLDLC